MSSLFRGISGRMFAIVLLPLAVLLATSLLSFNSLKRLSGSIQVLAGDRIPITQYVGELRLHMNATLRYAWTAYGSAADQRLNAVKQLQEATNDFNKALENLRTAEKSNDVQFAIKEVDDVWQQTSKDIMEVMLALSENTKEGDALASKIMVENLSAKDKSIADSLAKVDEAASGHTSEIVLASVETSQSVKNLLLGVVGGSFLIVSLIAFFMITGVSKSIRTISVELSNAGDRFSSRSVALAGANQDLSSNADVAASSLAETVASVEELTTMVKLNSENASQASTISNESFSAASEGSHQIKKLVSAVGEIASDAKRIEEIISVIDDIAFQTNLLALNAAVEAARAGDQGKGFAVVADAVRDLAQRTAHSAKDISGLIKTSVEKASMGASLASESGTVLTKIVESAGKVATLNKEISAASQEQSQGLSQISLAMNQLDQGVQANAASAKTVASTSDEIEAEARDLYVLVEQLKTLIDGSAGTGAKQVEEPEMVVPQKTMRPKPKFKKSA